MFEFETIPLRDLVRATKGTRAFYIPTPEKSGIAQSNIHNYASRISGKVKTKKLLIVDPVSHETRAAIEATVVTPGRQRNKRGPKA